MAHSTGQMVENTRECGRMESRMARENIRHRVEKQGLANGSMEKGLTGFQTDRCQLFA